MRSSSESWPGSSRRRAIPTLLEAWPAVLRAVPNAALLVVGEGSRRDELERQAASLRIAHRVVFTGRRDDVPSVTAALDVAVLPSYREAQGLSILEAMALSRPVVASRVGRDPRGDRGRRLGPARPAARCRRRWPAAIIRLLTDHPLADMIGRAGHDVVHERFCIGLMVQAVEKIYDEGAQRRPDQRGGRLVGQPERLVSFRYGRFSRTT